MNRFLKSLRVQLGDTQQIVANYLNISVNTYNFKENGKYKFTLEEAHKLSIRYKKTIEDIFFNDSDVIM